MTSRLLAIALLVPLALFAVACGSDDSENALSAPSSSTRTALTEAIPTSTPQPPTATPTPTPAPQPTMAPPAPPSGPPPTATRAPAPPAAATPSAPAPSGSTISVPFPFDNAVLARQSLLGTARFGGAMDGLDNLDPVDPKAYPGWSGVYPALRLVGSSINATPQTVSVYRNLLQDKQTPSATNPKVIVFAVMDNKGVCAAGVVRGFPIYNDYAPVEIGPGACNASAALAVLRR